jgi:hypothetical protein
MGAAREILCVQEDRIVGNDNTVKWLRLSLQLPPSRLRAHFVKADVRVHEYPHCALAVFWGPHRLGDYDAAGALVVSANGDGGPEVPPVTGSLPPGIPSRDGMQGEAGKTARAEQEARAGLEYRHVTKRKGAR